MNYNDLPVKNGVFHTLNNQRVAPFDGKHLMETQSSPHSQGLHLGVPLLVDRSWHSAGTALDCDLIAQNLFFSLHVPSGSLH